MRADVWIAGTALAFVTACGGSAPDRIASTARDASPKADPFALALAAAERDPPTTSWPRGLADAQPSAATCAYRYPDQLAERAQAFEAVVTDVRVSAAPEPGTPGDRRAVLTVVIGEVFAGEPPRSLEMPTWDFMLPPRPAEVIGSHILAAAGPTMDVMACGFTRPYSDRDAALWRGAFDR